MLTQTHSLLEVFLCTALIHTCILSKCTLHFTKDDKKKKKAEVKQWFDWEDKDCLQENTAEVIQFAFGCY